MLPEYLQPYSVIFILLLSMIFFIWRKWSYALTALIALSAAVVVGGVPVNQVFSGIDNPAVITVASIMVITSVIEKSNVFNVVINKLDAFTQSQWLHVLIFSFFAAFLSAFMNNVGALALMLPISISTAMRHNRSPYYLLMPIAMASAMGGMVTLIGTPSNLIVSNFRAERTGAPFNMFDFSYAGLLTAVVAVLFIGFLGWRLLPKQRKQLDSPKFLYRAEIRIHPKSSWIGEAFKSLNGALESTQILGLMRRNRKIELLPNTIIKSGDRFIIEATLDGLQNLSSSKEITIENYMKEKGKQNSGGGVLFEAIVLPTSKMQGKKIKETNLRAYRKISIIAILKSTKSRITHIKNVVMHAGDIVLIQCKDKSMVEKLPSIGFSPITESTFHVKTRLKNFVPLIVFVIAIALVGLSVVPVQIGFAGAALLMVLLDSSSLKYVYGRFDWSVIILLAAMIPIGQALTQTGGANLIANYILGLSQHLSILMTIGLLMFITMFLSDFMNNAATAIVMSPIAISLAQTAEISVDPFLMAVAIGASCAFLTPIGHQSNLLVMGPGRYKFFDYMRLGLPLEIIVLFVATPLVYWAWYLR